MFRKGEFYRLELQNHTEEGVPPMKEKTDRPQKIRLLSADAIKAIYEKELAREGGATGACDEAKLRKIVEELERLIPPDIEIDYISGEEIRNEPGL
jgi:hypothetical protein